MIGLLEFLLVATKPANEVQLESPHITISFRTDLAIFPRNWQTYEIKPQAEPITQSDESSCVSTLKSSLNKYPRSVVEANLKTIFVSSNLSFYGLNYGGTNSENAVYITLAPWREKNFNLRFLERAFHHELSSIFLRNYLNQFPQKSWNAALPTDFAYRGDGTQSLREGTASTKYEAEFNKKGFLAEYSTSSLEEDFNLFAEALFSGDRDFWLLYDRYPLLAKKADLVIDFYHEIDPSFAKVQFRRLAQAQTQ